MKEVGDRGNEWKKKLYLTTKRENSKMLHVSPSLLEIALNLVDQIFQSQSKYWENIFKIFNNIMSTRDALKIWRLR